MLHGTRKADFTVGTGVGMVKLLDLAGRGIYVVLLVELSDVAADVGGLVADFRDQPAFFQSNSRILGRG